MSKFKVGDEVVTISTSPFNGYEIGSRAVITGFYDKYIELEMQDGNCQNCYEKNIELAEIYNSPLYQMLNEEN